MGPNMIQDCRCLLEAGGTVEDVLRVLRNGHASKVESMRALVNLGLMGLREAKKVVHDSPVWADVRERDERFQQNLEDMVDGDGRRL